MNRMLRPCVGIALCLVSWPALADRATDAEMAEDALAPLAGHGSPSEKIARIQRFHDIVRERALGNPQARTRATVVFNHGLTVRRMAANARSSSLKMWQREEYERAWEEMEDFSRAAH